MADYQLAIKDTLQAEGAFNSKFGYVNDKDDAGGETVAGVARKFHSLWEGWKIVDSLKKHPRFPYNLKESKELNELVISFYKHEFWDKIGGDNIKSQNIASMLLKSAVHEGVVPAIKRAESIVGIERTGKTSEELENKLNSL